MSDYFKYSQAKRERATELPWDGSHEDTNHLEITSPWGTENYWIADCSNQKDLEYIVHACNTLPKIEALLELALFELSLCGNETGSALSNPLKTMCEIRAELQKLVGET